VFAALRSSAARSVAACAYDFEAWPRHMMSEACIKSIRERLRKTSRS